MFYIYYNSIVYSRFIYIYEYIQNSYNMICQSVRSDKIVVMKPTHSIKCDYLFVCTVLLFKYLFTLFTNTNNFYNNEEGNYQNFH